MDGGNNSPSNVLMGLKSTVVNCFVNKTFFQKVLSNTTKPDDNADDGSTEQSKTEQN